MNIWIFLLFIIQVIITFAALLILYKELIMCKYTSGIVDRKTGRFIDGSILCDATIKKLLDDKELVITEIEDKDIQPASVDIKISNSFLRIPKMYVDKKNNYVENKIYFGEPVEYKKEVVKDDEWVTIAPGEFILATTKSYIEIPDYITSWVEGRSSVGRIGLFTQNAGWIDPGFKGEITLELFNCNKVPIHIKPNQVVVQLVFAYLDKKPMNAYNGRYQGQRGATGSRQHIDM